jgi:putative sterol carrier protein
MTTIKELIEMMPGAFQPEKAAGIDAVVQFKFTGAEAGEYYVTIKDAKCNVTPGIFATPKLTVTADGGDFVKIFSGQMDGMQAFMQGKLRLLGDVNLAMKLLGLFKVK